MAWCCQRILKSYNTAQGRFSFFELSKPLLSWSTLGIEQISPWIWQSSAQIWGGRTNLGKDRTLAREPKSAFLPQYQWDDQLCLSWEFQFDLFYKHSPISLAPACNTLSFRTLAFSNWILLSCHFIWILKLWRFRYWQALPLSFELLAHSRCLPWSWRYHRQSLSQSPFLLCERLICFFLRKPKLFVQIIHVDDFEVLLGWTRTRIRYWNGFLFFWIDAACFNSCFRILRCYSLMEVDGCQAAPVVMKI